MYWAREARKGERRIVVTEDPVGWRGDMYSLYLLDRSVEQPNFLNDLNISRTDAAIISDYWRPPLVSQLSDTGGQWFIDVGPPSKVLANWTIYIPELSDRKATEVSAWVLDLIFRSFFIFSNDGDYHRNDGVRTNSWPERDEVPEGSSSDIQQQVPADDPVQLSLGS